MLITKEPLYLQKKNFSENVGILFSFECYPSNSDTNYDLKKRLKKF